MEQVLFCVADLCWAVWKGSRAMHLTCLIRWRMGRTMSQPWTFTTAESLIYGAERVLGSAIHCTFQCVLSGRASVACAVLCFVSILLLLHYCSVCLQPYC